MNKEKFVRYEGVRVSGITNMFNVKLVAKISGITEEECFDIMENYGKYKEEYLK